MVDIKRPFTPIQGLESVISSQAHRPGNLYFTTDSGKILLDTEERRVILGASGAAVYYATANDLKSNTDDSFTISHSHLEDSKAIPKKDDLIINVDGRFFKVNYFSGAPGVDGSFMNCKLIAVSGTGGGSTPGGPSGPGGDVEDPKYIQVEYDSNFSYSFLLGTDYGLTLTATSKLAKQLNIAYSVRNATGNTVDIGNKTVKSGEKVTLPIGRAIKPSGGLHAVDITITGLGVYTYTNSITKIRCVDLKVVADPEKFTSERVYNNSFSYYVKVYGEIAKTLHIEIDGKEDIDPISLTESQSNESQYVNINCETLRLEPGVHTITAYLMADGVTSNKINTDFIYHPLTAEDTTYVIITDYPERCLSYESPIIKYWVYDTSKPTGSSNTIIPSINGANLDAEFQTQEEGKALLWSVNGLVPNQDNRCGISCNGVIREIVIYCEKSTIFDETTSDAVVLLNANGRSNNTSLERRLQWYCENDKGQIITANLMDFNWKNNGWFLDEDGRNCLRISNGAKVEIPLQLFTNEQPSTGGFTFEFEFKPYNLYSYNLLTQATKTVEIEGKPEDDERVEVERVFDASLAAISYIAGEGENAYGVCCGTQDAFFRMSNGDNATVRYKDGNIVNIAVTINAASKQICMYVNGIMSGMVAYKTSANLPIQANKLLINSDQCDLDLYNIRIYNKALSFNEITQNYIASKKNLQIYAENNFASGQTVNLSSLIDYNTNNPSNATIPYIIFKTKKSPDLLPYNKANEDVICDIKFVNPGLDYALDLGEIDTDYYKKHAPSFQATDVNLNVQGTSSQKYPRKNFKGKFKKATSWKCTHPKMKEESLSKFSIREGMAEKTFTWKADYMDSSSCHNTGFASYVYELYKNHPLDYYEGTTVAAPSGSGAGEYHKQYRTSLFGFPVLAFHEKSDGTSEFIGLYNFNLDKGADDTLGMALDKNHPVLKDKTYKKVCECWEMANNMGGRCSFRGAAFDSGYDYIKKQYIAYDDNGNIIEGTTDLGEDLEVRYHYNGDAIEGAWENRNLPSDDKDSVYIGSEAAFEVLLGGNADGTGRTGAYKNLEIFFKWLNSCFYAFDLNNDEDKNWVEPLVKARALLEKENGFFENIIATVDEYRTKHSQISNFTVGSAEYINTLNESNDLAAAIIEAGMMVKDEHYNISKELFYNAGENKWIAYNTTNITIDNDEIITILNTRKNNIDETYTIQKNAKGEYYNEDNSPVDVFYRLVREDRKNKFESEFNDHLNYEYCMVYYIMTELLLQFDSRGKNMMFASWGPMKEGGDYVWFPIYYDVDTQLGVNNSGIPSWEYNVEPTTGFNNSGGARAFSTANSLLWQNFHESYVVNKPAEIRSFYQGLRGGNLKENKLNEYYNFEFTAGGDYCMKGILPISVFNANQYYKYIEPSIKGYPNGIKSDGSPSMRITDAYFYCLQGTRELHRALFLRNRFNYYDSKWMAQDYQPGTGGDNQFWRINAHLSDRADDVKSNLLFHIKPSLDQYIVIWPDDDTPKPIFAKGGEIVEIDLSSMLTNTETYNQQIIHIGGPDYIQEYGNVSLLYVDEHVFQSPAVTKIELGNESPNYIPDPNFSTAAIGQTTSNKPLLKVFDITNIKGMGGNKEFSSIELYDSIKLEEFKALGTKLTQVDFADGVNLSKLYLPETITRLTLKNAMALDNIVYNKADIEEEIDGVVKQNKPGLYIENVVDEKKTKTNINVINIVSGSLKQHSYKLLRAITQAHQSMMETNDNDTLQVAMEEVHWTPFTQLGDGAKYKVSDKDKYYETTANASFKLYNYIDEETWNKDILSGKIYFYEPSEVDMATNMWLLDTYINDEKKHFTNVSGNLIKDYPVITGSMYIENTENNKISEAALFDHYAKYFPDLDIRAKYIEDAYRARFVTYNNGVEKEIFIQRVGRDKVGIKVDPPMTGIPLPNYSVFEGWSLVKPTGNYSIDSQHLLSEEELAKYYFGETDPRDPYAAPEYTFYAIFNRQSYIIQYKDTTTIPGEISKFYASFTQLHGDALIEPVDVPYRETEESTFEIQDRLAFVGWTDIESNSGIAATRVIAEDLVINLSNYKADRNYTFYPVYVKENVYDKATDEKYFLSSGPIGKATGGNIEGYTLIANPAYKLRGKVTIPATYKGYPVVAIGANNDYLNEASGIFFMENPNLTEIKQNAFISSSANQELIKLKGVYLPESITHIGNSAFENLKGLEHLSDRYVKTGEIGYLNDNLVVLGSRAFRSTSLKAADGTYTGPYINKIPSGLTKIDSYAFHDAGPNIQFSELPNKISTIAIDAFRNCPNVRIVNFGLSSGDVGAGSALQSITGPNVFSNVEIGAHSTITDIYVWDSVTTIKAGAFQNYGLKNSGDKSGVILHTSHKSKPEGWEIKIENGIELTDAESLGVKEIQYGYEGEA